MEPYKVEFDSLPWETPMPGVRIRVFSDGQRQIRLAEFSMEFVEPHWCEKRRIDFCTGELEVDFHGQRIRYAESSGIFIPKWASHGHKARSITSSVLLFLAEEA
jgi:hypothetical protein